MSAGRKSVGHPVDVATGVMYNSLEDVRVPGQVVLDWSRFYSTALRSHTGAFGPGWTNRYFCSLGFVNGEYRFTGPDGATITIADPDREATRGGVIRNLGAFTELWFEAPNFVVCQWNVYGGDVWCYLFPYDNSRERDRFRPLAEIRDPAGQGVELSYDGQQRLAAVRQKLERRSLALSYDGHDRIDSVEFHSADDRVRHTLARYAYDARGRLVAAGDAHGFTDRYEYDDEHRIVREATKSGSIVNFRYDDKGRCVRTRGLDGYDEKSLRYLDSAGWTEVTDSLGHVCRYQRNGDGQILSEVDALGAMSASEFDEYGRLIRTTDPLGAVMSFEYDESGNCRRITDAIGGVQEFAFERFHRVTGYTDTAGSVWRRQYDATNRLTESEDPEGNRYRFRYDKDGRVREIVNPVGNVMTREFDQSATRVSVVNWNGGRSMFRLDEFGRLIEYIDELKHTSAYSRDLLGNLVKIDYPDGTCERFGYDGAANLTKYVDRDGGVTKFSFGPCSRLAAKTDPLGRTTRFQWGSEPGRLKSVINSREEVYRFEFDANGMPIAEIGFDGRVLRYEYDKSGARSASINALEERTEYRRDPLGRLVELLTADDCDLSFTYSAAGFLASASNGSSRTTFQRDRSGRVLEEVQNGCLIRREYDKIGNRTRMSSGFGSEVLFEFDANGRLSSCRLDDHGPLKFSRDARGSETRRSSKGCFELHSEYDAMGRLQSQSTATRPTETARARTAPLADLIERRYSYEGTRLIEMGDRYWGDSTHVYDPADRLIHSMRERGVSEEFRYDVADNLSMVKRDGQESQLEYGPGNVLTRDGNIEFQFDAQGRMVRRVERRSGAGASEDVASVWEYDWNSLDQLRRVTDPDGGVWQYVYDPFGRRIEKISPAGIRYGFVWDNSVVLHELRDEVPIATWVFDPHRFSPLCKSEGDDLYCVVTDQLGTPRELIDGTGNVVWRASYLAWGEIAEVQSDGVDCPIAFQGQWRDGETGLCYNRFRYYDPRIGRYISADPVGLRGGTNLFRYARNPIGWIDPFGLICETDDNDGNGYVVYHITDEDGNVLYVGLTQADRFRERRDEHVSSGRLHPDENRFMAPVVWAQTYGEIRGIEQAHIQHANPNGSTRNTNLIGQNSPEDLRADPANRVNSVSEERINNRDNPSARDQAFQNSYDNEVHQNGW